MKNIKKKLNIIKISYKFFFLDIQHKKIEKNK